MRFLLLLFLMFPLYSCTEESKSKEDVEITNKLNDLEGLVSALQDQYNDLHSELERYAIYRKPGLFQDKDYTKVDLKLYGITDYYMYSGKLKEAYDGLGNLKRFYANADFEKVANDNNVISQLSLCFNYQTKENVLDSILINLSDAIKELESEEDFAKTDLKLNRLNKSELTARINSLFEKYNKSNFEFHGVNTTPSYDVLQQYWNNK